MNENFKDVARKIRWNVANDNLKEIASVLCKYIDTNEIDYNNLYPSFPTGGIIINKK